MRLTGFIAIAVLTIAAYADAAPKPRPPDYWIFSWVMRDGSYRFILVRERERLAFIDGFEPSFPGHGGASELQAQLARLPRQASVGWGDRSCVGLTYPPKDVMRPILMFAKQRGILVQILPRQCEG
jgi:hypothetical protein